MFYINANISATAQQVSLRNSGAASLAATALTPFYLIITRASDGLKEIVREVAVVSATDLTILRGQLGSTALAFVAGDSVDIIAIPNTLPIQFIYLGSPALSNTSVVHASIALTAGTQAISTGITNPDVCRQGSVTGNQAGIVGNVTFHGLDALGGTLSEAVALAGTATVFTTNAFATITSFDLPVETHAGADSVIVGVGPALGIPVSLPRNTVLIAYLNNVKEATAPTVTFGAVGATKITLNSALAGTPVSLYLING